MPNQVVVTRGSVPDAKREDVGAGLIFRLRKKDGSLGENFYASIGRNGKFWSINTVTGALASTDNGDKRVAIVGKYEWDIKFLPNSSDWTATTRGAVTDGQVFAVGDDPGTLYLHIGTANDGKMLAVNLKTFDYAVSDSPRKAVTVRGNAVMKTVTV